MLTLLNDICTDSTLARIHYRRHRPWTAKDYFVFAVGAVVYFAARYFLPKFFPTLETKLADKISLGIAFGVMILLLFVIM